MKKTVMITLLSAATLLLFANTADAKSFDDKTDVGVNFKSDEPTVQGENKPYKDNLALVWKPSSFQFGEQKAVGNSATFSNVIQSNQYLIVNDDRKTASTPWALKASLSELKSTDGSKSLASKLTFALSDAQSYTIGDTIGEDNDYIPNKPEASGSLGTLDPNAGITLGDGKVKAMTLVAGETTGQAVLEKKAANDVKGGVATLIKDAKLVVTDAKADQAAGESFTGYVTWTLDDLQP
ncbi:WxL domain-containing protein [Candidatus Enterococcus ikei]|uniref:WxL domain-containing protein n=1 Tax=Candidatus Enterococcus ikei TaxID=2815326 RepID=A0ABS3H0P7_9ENTE|nr:WxL domain-containing protein [Enterococcus sp. DIV0869a]MBO0441094.1 WxL domain-containing protein [Enterococcus sp. DIV0869a]